MPKRKMLLSARDVVREDFVTPSSLLKNEEVRARMLKLKERRKKEIEAAALKAKKIRELKESEVTKKI
jgi:hypothetical protein